MSEKGLEEKNNISVHYNYFFEHGRQKINIIGK
jgi:hypothetical protein